MNKASYDDQDWAKLVREIELAKAACKTPIDGPDAIAPIDVRGAEAPIGTALGQHELVADLAELLDTDILAGEKIGQSRISGIRSHIGWGLGGFLLGAIVWHLVGFWDFVGDVVLSGPQNTTIVERTVVPDAKPRVLSYVRKRPPGSSAETSKNCSAFYRDFDTGLARSSRCQTVLRALGDGENTRK